MTKYFRNIFLIFITIFLYLSERMTIKDRVYLFLNYKNITVKRFEEECDLSNGYISSMRKGFGTQKLNNVLTKYPELNREWLLYGEGEMLKSATGSQLPTHSSQPDERLSEPSTGYYPTSASQENQLLRQHIAALERTIRDKEEIIHLLKQKLQPFR